MNIDEMPAGREIDALVAERVMGWTEVVMFGMPPKGLGVPPEGDDLYGTTVEGGIKASIPGYSTDIAAARQVVEKMRFLVMPCDDEMSILWFVANHTVTTTASIPEMMPLTICRVALKLMEVTEIQKLRQKVLDILERARAAKPMIEGSIEGRATMQGVQAGSISTLEMMLSWIDEIAEGK